jgi:hypothetical protein
MCQTGVVKKKIFPLALLCYPVRKLGAPARARPIKVTKHAHSNLQELFASARRFFFSTRQRHPLRLLAVMPQRRRGVSDFRGVRPCPNVTFYAKLRTGGYRLTLGTYPTAELAAWRFLRPRRDMNFWTSSLSRKQNSSRGRRRPSSPTPIVLATARSSAGSPSPSAMSA